MGMQTEINAFVDAMIESKEKFETMKASFDEKNNKLESCIASFKSNVDRVLSRKYEIEDSEIQKMFDSTSKELKDLLIQVTKSMENTKKGMKFIEAYEQSFNVAVFGKVKAGKSYLGNFIMGNVIRDLGVETSYDKLERPLVEVYDRGKKSVNDKLEEISEEGNAGFRVDPNEATSAIQLFRLGGMTWFDTPGIGSITWENEMLAKDYVDNADLVVYTSNSDAAGTRLDFAEMKELYEKGKSFLLLLTQSDTIEEDYDEEEDDIISILKPKSEYDRNQTEEYMCDTLRENDIMGLTKGKEILTISTKLALTALEENDEEMFYASNIDKFLKILTNITQNEGAELKLKTPNTRMNATTTELIKILKSIQEQLKEYELELTKKRKKLVEKNDLVMSEMQGKCSTAAAKIIRKKVEEIEHSGITVSEEELADLLNTEVYNIIVKTCLGEFAKTEQVLTKFTNKLKMENVGTLEMRQDTIEYEIQEVVRCSRSPRGLRERAGAFFLNKSYYTSSVNTVKKTSKIDLGVNTNQIQAITQDQINQLFAEEVPSMMLAISDHILEPVLETVRISNEEINHTIAELENLRC